MKYLQLDLDEFNTDFIYTSFDIGGKGHDIVISAENKEDFIKEFLQNTEAKLRENLIEVEQHD